MHLDEHLVTDPDRMCEHVLVQHVRVYDGFLDPHREQRIRIAAEGLCIEKVPPAADELSCEKAEHRRVRDGEELHLPPVAENHAAEDAGQDATIDGETALSEVEDLPEMLRVVVPLEDHIVGTCTENGENDAVQREVFDVL